MKSKIFFMITIILVCLFTVSCRSSEAVENTVLKFELSDISFADEILENFTPEKLLGKKIYLDTAETAEDVKEKIEPIWFEIFSESEIIQQRPYIICMNEDESLWYIYGNDDYLNGALGGVVNAIVSKEDGEVLAIWHEEWL